MLFDIRLTPIQAPTIHIQIAVQRIVKGEGGGGNILDNKIMKLLPEHRPTYICLDDQLRILGPTYGPKMFECILLFSW